MKWKFNDLLILMVIFAVLMFFGTAVWMVVQNITSGKVRWVFDILSAFLFISLLFWLFVLDDSIKSGK
jgi:glucan phosphoethanolaminetransferase (alkaline phosphatase superfamily)